VVDQWTGFDTDTDTYDGVHPNDEGYEKIADGLRGLGYEPLSPR
jgi:lysophospholipase L1-like esterase